MNTKPENNQDPNKSKIPEVPEIPPNVPKTEFYQHQPQ